MHIYVISLSFSAMPNVRLSFRSGREKQRRCLLNFWMQCDSALKKIWYSIQKSVTHCHQNMEEYFPSFFHGYFFTTSFFYGKLGAFMTQNALMIFKQRGHTKKVRGKVTKIAWRIDGLLFPEFFLENKGCLRKKNGGPDVGLENWRYHDPGSIPHNDSSKIYDFCWKKEFLNETLSKTAALYYKSVAFNVIFF